MPQTTADGLLTRAAGNPLVRGGLTIVAGILTGNALGVLRVGLTAYLLGTHSRADSLAVAMGPIDTLNSVLTNSMVFAFVPLLTACSGAERIAIFRKLGRGFLWVFSSVTLALLLAAPWIMRALAPGLTDPYFASAVQLLRILSLSTFFAGSAAVYWALLFTDRRFGLAAFYQAAVNVCTIAGALCLWKTLGVYAFAVGYTAGAAVQLATVYLAHCCRSVRRGVAPRTTQTTTLARRVRDPDRGRGARSGAGRCRRERTG